MGSSVIPIQGTFDVAKGRNSLRTEIARQCWPGTLNVRASATLTALGDLIVHSKPTSSVPVHVDFHLEGPRPGIHICCTMSSYYITQEALARIQNNLNTACDELVISWEDDKVSVDANICI